MFEKKLFCLKCVFRGVALTMVPKNIIVCPSETKIGVIIASDVCDTMNS